MHYINLQNIESFIVISDVHLRSPQAERTSYFYLVLRDILQKSKNNSENKIEALFLLGDIFDFIFVEKKYFIHKWMEFFSICKEFQENNIKVYFLEGNHDFGFVTCKDPLVRQAFTLAGDYKLILSHSVHQQIGFMHGDDVVCKPNYLKFRSLVRNLYVQMFAKLFPGFLMDFVFSCWALVSRRKDNYRQMDNDFLNTCLSNHSTFCYQLNYHPTIFFLGHIHISLDTHIQSTRYLATTSWLTGPMFLHCNSAGKITRHTL